MVLRPVVKPQTMLTRMEWDETSGVDHPANLEEQWLVQKSAAGALVDDLQSRMTKDDLDDQLDDYDWSGAPPEVKQAAAVVCAWLRSYDADDGTDPSLEGGSIGDPNSAVLKTAETPPVVTPSDDSGSKKKSRASRLISRLLSKANVAPAATPETPTFDHEAAIMKALVASWPDFCGRTASVVKSADSVDLKKSELRKALSNLVSDVALEYDLDRWSFQHGPFTKRDFTPEQRKALAAKGHAMADGSYPIENEDDLKNAISAFGRGKGKPGLKAYIIGRAKALGLTSLLPDTW